MSERIVAEAWPLAFYLAEEMDARGWTTLDVATRMGGKDIGRDVLIVGLLLAVHRDGLLFGDDVFAGLARAFDLSEEFLRNLDAAWRKAPPETRQKFEAPDHLFEGIEFPSPSPRQCGAGG